MTITTAVKIAFAAINSLIWTGLFLYLLRLNRKVRNLEAIGLDEREAE